MKHSFDIELAKEYGILEAILMENIYFWIEKNKANNKHFYDGKYWTYNSQKAFSELFPYASERKIQLALEGLISKGLLESGNYNKNNFDRTKWYSITQKGYIMLQNVESESAKMLNENTQNVEPIPYINTDIYTDNINYICDNNAKKFQKPTLQQVKAYCEERKNNIDAEHFIDYYEANGWKVGRNSMKDWKATVRTWEKNNNNKSQTIQTYQERIISAQEKAREEFLKGE